MLTRLQAKATLKEKGWSYRTVAPLLDVHHIHLSMVLNGHRVSRRLLNKIEGLPARPAKEAA